MSADVALVSEVRRLMDGANVHRLRGALAMYQTAAADSHPASQSAARDMERDLAEECRRLRAARFRA